MNEIAARSELLPDTDPAGAPGMRPGTTGILPYQSLVQMVRAGDIKGVPNDLEPDQIQPASLDLRLGRTAYRVRASFLPGPNATVLDKIHQLDGHPIDLADGAVLETGCVYV